MSKPISRLEGGEPAVENRVGPRWMWPVILVGLVTAGSLLWWAIPAQDPLARLAAAHTFFEAGELVRSAREAELAYEWSEGDSVTRGAAAMVLARIAEAHDRLPEAATWYDRVPDLSPDAPTARLSAGMLYADPLHRLGDSIDRFTSVLRVDPGSLPARRRLAQMLGLANRNHEAQPHLVALVRLGNISHLELLLLILGEETIDSAEVLGPYRSAAPSDPHPLIALARLASQSDDTKKANQLLEQAIAADGTLVEPVVRLGELLVQTGDLRGLLKWEQQLVTSEVREHPGGQVVRGDMFRLAGAPRRAAVCYLEAVRRDPNRPEACYRLGRILVGLGDKAQAAVFLDRARRVEAYIQAAKVAESAEAVDDLIRRSRDLGLAWEEYAWSGLQIRVRPEDRSLAEKLPQLAETLKGLPLQRTRPGANPAEGLDLSSYPDPELDAELIARLDRPSGTGSGVVDVEIRFEEISKAAGLDFQFVNGARRPEDIRFMYQTTGGGVGVLDFDHNGWPDLWWTQGTTQPTDSGGSHSDALYLNIGNGQVLDVSLQAGISETRFSQGLAVGDVDSDGFPDVLVANLIENQLWMNNGDGTFTPSELAGAGQKRWTTSCLVADLDGDGLPDLYEVNYLAGDDVFSRRCQGPDKKPGICTPQTFEGATDRILRNLGDGRFQEVSSRWKLERPGGSGLGIVAARLGDSTPLGRLDLFIANDTRANFLYRPPSSSKGISAEAWEEIGLVRGLALNDAGRAEACMGIAAGDVDGDGRIDLFVTNFLDETNTLYRQNERGGFVDFTRAAGLESPSRDQLGFGAQFLDLDLDGVLDLVLTNGHIEETGPEGRPFRMSPQVFLNDGSGRFQLVSADQLGKFFEGKYLGRGLARLDFNRDGAPDVAISHVDRRAALLINRTPERGHHLVVRLVGTSLSRDAIGTTVAYRLGKRRVVRQLTAGDGFQASNHRVLLLGLGESDSVPAVEVTWPSGRVQVFEGLPLDGEVVLVEGRAESFGLPAPESIGR
jgi:tetratricopeptide (TPR) repeat protein